MGKGIAFFNFLAKKKLEALLQHWDLRGMVNVLRLFKIAAKKKQDRQVLLCHGDKKGQSGCRTKSFFPCLGSWSTKSILK